MSRRTVIALVIASSLLAGCDMLGGVLGIESPEKVAAARDAEGKAIGGACRNAGRAIEDCFALNRKSDKAAMFAGWREMNDYMRENKIEAVAPHLADAKATVADAADAADSAKPTAAVDKPAAKGDAPKRGKAHDS
jgi:hypothetical protein